FLYPILLEVGWKEAPFTQMPAKGAYMWRDLERQAILRGLPYNKPAVYPPNSLQSGRVGILAAKEGWCADFTRHVFHGHFVEGRMIGEENTLREALAALGKEPDEVIAAAQSPENKEALHSQTDQAKKLGIFGAPSFVVDNELFWGDDRLENALAWQGQD
ncbi:MAG: 2-hydroxychromene-2-carboxylate isomerase, partial [bacterium]